MIICCSETTVTAMEVVLSYILHLVLFLNNVLNYKYQILRVFGLQLRSKSRNILIGSICRPPPSSVTYANCLIDNIEKNAVSLNDDLIVLGDFNWDSNRYPDRNYISLLENSCGLNQLVQGPTRLTLQSPSTIDLIFSSYPLYHKYTQTIKYALSDHYLVFTQKEAIIRNISTKPVLKGPYVTLKPYETFLNPKFSKKSSH